MPAKTHVRPRLLLCRALQIHTRPPAHRHSPCTPASEFRAINTKLPRRWSSRPWRQSERAQCCTTTRRATTRSPCPPTSRMGEAPPPASPPRSPPLRRPSAPPTAPRSSTYPNSSTTSRRAGSPRHLPPRLTSCRRIAALLLPPQVQPTLGECHDSRKWRASLGRWCCSTFWFGVRQSAPADHWSEPARLTPRLGVSGSAR
jgi:hypothetical protein